MTGSCRIFIAVSMLSEAKPVIQSKGLKRISQETAYQIFQKGNIHLIVTGVGGMKAMMATTYLLTRFQAQKTDFLLTYGISAFYKGASDFKEACGRLYLARSIRNAAFRRTCYPDLLYATPFPEADLVTLPAIYHKNETSEMISSIKENNEPVFSIRDAVPVLVEMEAAFVYEAASQFLFAHHIFVLKMVSDDGTCTTMTKQAVYDLVMGHTAEIAGFVEWLEKLENTSPEDKTGTSGNREIGKTGTGTMEPVLLDKINYDLRLTSYQQNELRQLAGRYLLRKKSFDSILAEIPKTGVKTKREGKAQYERLRKLLMEP